MNRNLIKEKIKAGGAAIGSFVKFADPAVVEVLALSGFNFFVLDNEHVAMDKEQLVNILRAAEAFGITPMVRVRENNQVEILQNLDLGYAGVQVPNIDTPDDARRLVASVKYSPEGVRGFSPSVRACRYGTMSIPEYIQAANENTLIAAHCETKTCVDNLDEILTVPGIDVIFIGPMDLSQSLGVTGEVGSQIVKDTVDLIFNKVKKSDKAVGTVAGTTAAAKALIEKGAQYILLSSDQGIMLNAAKNMLADIRGK